MTTSTATTATEILASCACTLVWVAPTCSPAYLNIKAVANDPARYGTIAELMEAQLSQLPRSTKVSIMGYQAEVDGGNGLPHCELHDVSIDEAMLYLHNEKQDAMDFDATLFPILASDLKLFS